MTDKRKTLGEDIMEAITGKTYHYRDTSGKETGETYTVGNRIKKLNGLDIVQIKILNNQTDELNEMFLHCHLDDLGETQ